MLKVDEGNISIDGEVVFNDIWIKAIQKYMPDIRHYGCNTPDEYIKEFHEYMERKFKPQNFGNNIGPKVIDIY